VTVTKKIYSNGIDGYAYTREGSWAAARSTNTAYSASSLAASGWGVIAEKDSALYQNGQSHFFFNTASIPASAVVTGATMKVYGYYHSTYAANNQKMTLVGSLLTGAPGSADANKVGSVEFTSTRQTVPNENSTAYISLPLNASGLAAINRSGTTALATRMSYDMDNTMPTGRNLMQIWFSEAPDISQRPYLEVTYTVSSAELLQLNSLLDVMPEPSPASLLLDSASTSTAEALPDSGTASSTLPLMSTTTPSVEGALLNSLDGPPPASTSTMPSFVSSSTVTDTQSTSLVTDVADAANTAPTMPVAIGTTSSTTIQ
jgi:hypothetical protein